MQPDAPRPGRRRARSHRRGAPPPEPLAPREQAPHEAAPYQAAPFDPSPFDPASYEAPPPDRPPYEREPPDGESGDPALDALLDPDRSGTTDSFAVDGLLGIGGDLDRAFGAARRSRIRNLVLGVGSLTVVTATGIGAFVAWGIMSSGPPSDVPFEGAGTVRAAPPGSVASPAASGGPPGFADTAPPSAPVARSERGSGKFVRAPAAVPPQTFGHGRLVRYRVEVEGGLGLSPALFAREVDRVLADARGWTASGKRSFRRVAAGKVDFAVRLASAPTAQRICRAYGLEADATVNCAAGRQVVINLGRWLAPSAPFRSSAENYRAFLLNHELGHHFGAGHRTCGGDGRPAPVMQDQIAGLNGCRANAWPYDAHGRFATGPEQP
ncbi:hypothetical protein BTM25_50960 [Actinomadura rubteroloni]|uniref:DUF3152 domain-containing protein n=1 Tax=Actinomadura rubteroloni TaxID=1926885 RepID=A0A2P4UCX2_9ACTN|nr:DUF3152 domain-containing protein [Actinomadura rubteroloni]POM22890.1 hypothetical protein BTM25_50960 [Actinomadura rubteroloni]